MSRIGQKNIFLPHGVETRQEGSFLFVCGSKGELHLQIHPSVFVEKKMIENKDFLEISVSQPEKKEERSLWGTTRALIQNMVTGVTEGFKKSLEIIGVGYRVNLKGKELIFEVGYSHPVSFLLPEGIQATVENNIVTLTGIDRQLVGEIAARIRKIRKPEPYKGKGIKYLDEVIRRKAGKTSAT